VVIFGGSDIKPGDSSSILVAIAIRVSINTHLLTRLVKDAVLIVCVAGESGVIYRLGGWVCSGGASGACAGRGARSITSNIGGGDWCVVCHFLSLKLFFTEPLDEL